MNLGYYTYNIYGEASNGDSYSRYSYSHQVRDYYISVGTLMINSSASHRRRKQEARNAVAFLNQYAT